MSKLNCWEFKKCGRQPGGALEKDKGICPASVESKLHGQHGGMNGGRSCWVVAGTLCQGSVQGTFATKSGSCLICDFYKHIRNEEAHRFILSPVLLNILRNGDALRS